MASTHAHRIQRKFILNQTRRITNTTGTSNELITTDDCRKTDCFEEIVEYRHKQVKEDQMKPVDLREFKENGKIETETLPGKNETICSQTRTTASFFYNWYKIGITDFKESNRKFVICFLSKFTRHGLQQSISIQW